MPRSKPNPDLIKRLAELVDGDGWQVADLLVEEFPPEQYESGNGTNNALYAALDDCEDELRTKYAVELKVSTMRRYRATALAWPADVRTSAASFVAHEAVRGTDREAQMASYLKRNKGLPLSKRHVKRYRSDDNPKPPVPWDIAMRKSFDATARRYLLGGIIPTPGTDWWTVPQISEEARGAVALALHDLANRLTA